MRCKYKLNTHKVRQYFIQNITSTISYGLTIRHLCPGLQLTVFNSQSVIQLGGRWNPTLTRVERPFAGVMAGLVYNGLRPLDVAADATSLEGKRRKQAGASSKESKGRGRAKIQGAVRVLDAIPFDYKERHPKLFRHRTHGMQRTNAGSRVPEPGIGDDLIYGRTRCGDPDDDRYYDPQCFTFEGSGKAILMFEAPSSTIALQTLFTQNTT